MCAPHGPGLAVFCDVLGAVRGGGGVLLVCSVLPNASIWGSRRKCTHVWARAIRKGAHVMTILLIGLDMLSMSQGF